MLALIAAAAATETLVHAEGAFAEATAHLQRIGGGDTGEVRVVTLAQLVAGSAPAAVAGARLVPCVGGPRTALDLEHHAVRAGRAMAYMEQAEAVRELDAAVAALPCLDTLVPSPLGARIYFLRGVLAFDMGDRAAAKASFERARGFSPDLAWDPDLPPDARDLFEDAEAPPAGLWLHLVPAPPAGEVWVDGRPVALEGGRVALGAGRHVVQIDGGGVSTFAIEVSGTDGALVRPAAVPPDALVWVEDPARRPALTSVFEAALEPEATVYVAGAGRLWRVHAGRDDWEELNVPEKRGVGRTERIVGASLLGVGGAALIGGSLLAGTGYAEASDAAGAAGDAATRQAYADAESRHHAAVSRLHAGEALGVGGVALVAVGAVVAF